MRAIPEISIVTSLYNSSSYIDEFYTQHLEAINTLGLSYEFIFVNDGSPDDSLEKVIGLIEMDKNIRVVDLARNFGQYAAMFAGLSESSGNFVYMSDSDLEDSPKNLVLFFEELLRDPNLDVIYGVVKKRKGKFIRKNLGALFFHILKTLSGFSIPENQTWQRVMTRRYVNSLLKFNEVETFPAGLLWITGYNQKPIFIDRNYKGNTSYTFVKRFRAALDAITSFSSKPLFYIGISGFILTLFAFIFLTYVVISKMLFADYQAGWTTLIASIWFVGGITLSSLGIIGIYISKIFTQVKNRPLFTVKEVFEDEESHNKEG